MNGRPEQWHKFCTRNTKAGKSCWHHETRWPAGIKLPDPHSCPAHLTIRERTAWDAYHRILEALAPVPYDYSPACWSWLPPTEADCERVRVAWEQSLGDCADEALPAAEGMNRLADSGRVWREYRQRNPASICGVRERYWNPFTREFAEPEQSSHDPWRDNPMTKVGL